MNTEQKVRKVFQLRAEAKAAEEEAKELLAELQDELEVGTQVIGPYLVNAIETKRFDAALAEKALTKAEYASILKQVPDAKKAEVLYPKKFEKCRKTYGLTVRIDYDKEN